MLVSSRHGAIRLWDLRKSSAPVVRYTVHMNGQFILRCGSWRARPACSAAATTGRECTCGHPMVSGEPIRILEGHQGASYRAIWNSKLGLMASCGDDRTVRT